MLRERLDAQWREHQVSGRQQVTLPTARCPLHSARLQFNCHNQNYLPTTRCMPQQCTCSWLTTIAARSPLLL